MLEVALATNSFYAASLTASDGGFELIAHDPASENKAYHLKAMESCERAGPRVNWKFADNRRNRSRRPALGGREKNSTRQLSRLCSFPSVC